MTVKETMLFRIFILFLSVVIIQSEFRTELWRTQEDEYENRNNLRKYSKDYQPAGSNGRSQIYFPSNNPFEKPKIEGSNPGNSAHEWQENNFGVFTHKRRENNIGDTTYKRKGNNFGDSTYKPEENNIWDSTYKREENNFGDSTYKREGNNFGDSTYKPEENNIGDSTYKREGNNFGDSTYKREENNFGDPKYKREENNSGGSTNKREGSNIGDSTYKREENNFGDSTNKREENNSWGSTNKREENKDSTPQRGENISGNSPSPGGLTPEEKCGLDVPRRIIGGATTDIDEFPWLCLLKYVDPSGNVSYDCSGVLISKRYVLTAAHCTNGPGLKAREMKLQRVRLGEWDISSDKDCQGDVCSSQLQEIDVEDVIPHESYKPRDKSQVNDIALIRLSREANLNQFVQPICLPSAKIGGMDYEDKKLTVAGWGRTSNARDSSSNVKMKVNLPIVSRERCRQFYLSFYGNLRISESQFCAGGEEGKDTCQGDSGGPLMTIERTNNEIKWYVIGIVSSGPAACGVQDRPSLYTNVSQYANWIMNNIKN